MRTLLFFLATLATAVTASEPPQPPIVEIVPPAGEILVRDYAQLRITGATVEQLRRSQLTWFPRTGVDVMQAIDWDGQPFLLFRSRVPGGFLVFLALPPTDAAKGRVAKAEVVLQVAGEPQPDPKPQPDPRPTPITQVWAVIVYESGQDLKPTYSEILRGKALQDWFVAQKWVGPDGLPSLVRIDQDVPVGVLDPGKRAWIEGVKSVVKGKGAKLPQLAWCGTQGGAVTVEDIKPTLDEQIKRLEQIAREGK